MKGEIHEKCVDCIVIAICDKYNKNGSWKHKGGKVPCQFDAKEDPIRH